MGPFNTLRRRMSIATFSKKRDDISDIRGIPEVIGTQDKPTEPLVPSRPSLQRHQVACSTPTATSAAPSNCSDCKVWTDHDFANITSGALTISEVVFEPYQTGFIRGAEASSGGKHIKKSHHDRYLQAGIRLCTGEYLPAKNNELIRSTGESYCFSFECPPIRVTPSTTGTLELYIVHPSSKQRSKHVALTATELRRSVSNVSRASGSAVGSRESCRSNGTDNAVAFQRIGTSITLASVSEENGMVSAAPSTLIGVCKFRLQQLQRDAGLGTATMALSFDGVGVVASTPPRQGQALAGNALIVKNRFTMLVEVRTRFLSTIAEGRVNVNIQSATSVGSWYYRYCVLNGQAMKLYTDETMTILKTEIKVCSIRADTIGDGTRDCLRENTLKFDTTDGGTCHIQLDRAQDVARWINAFNEAVHLDNAWGMN